MGAEEGRDADVAAFLLFAPDHSYCSLNSMT